MRPAAIIAGAPAISAVQLGGFANLCGAYRPVYLTPFVRENAGVEIASHQKLIIVYGSIPADIDWTEPKELLDNRDYDTFSRKADADGDPLCRRLIDELKSGRMYPDDSARRKLSDRFNSVFRRVRARNDNGLVSSAVPMLSKLGGSQLRVIGFSVRPPGVSEATMLKVSSELDEVNITPVFINDQQQHLRRNVFGRGVLWPAMHGFTHLLPEEDVIEEALSCYLSLGNELAHRIAAEASAGARDVGVWCHDYSTLGAMYAFPEIAREMKMGRVRTSYFHHVVFPDTKTMANLPRPVVAMIGGALSGFDVLAFHTETYARNAAAMLNATNSGFMSGENLRPIHASRILVDPISVDASSFNPLTIDMQILSSTSNALQLKILENPHMAGKRILYYVGRADYTKGILEALNAYRLLLLRDDHVRRAGETIFAVHAPPEASVYQKAVYFMEVMRAAASINAEFGDESWRFLVSKIDAILRTKDHDLAIAVEEVESVARQLRERHDGWLPVSIDPRGSLDRGTMLAYAMASDLMIMPSIADGLGLVAKEWVVIKYLHGVLSDYFGSEVPTASIGDENLSEALLPCIRMLENHGLNGKAFRFPEDRRLLIMKMMRQILSIESGKPASKLSHPLSPGALLIGRGAGAAAGLPSAFIFDPTVEDTFRNTIANSLVAVESEPEDLLLRWGNFYERVIENQVMDWGGRQVGALFNIK